MLEVRCVPSGFYVQANLVSDVPGMAQNVDPNLKNPWGIVPNTSGALWVADNGAGVSTLYAGTGQSFPIGHPLVVTIPSSAGGAPPATPTGIVFNTSNNFMVTGSFGSGASAFIFATEDGTISGWSPKADATHAILAVDNSANGAVYKGLALVGKASGEFLLAANFNSGKIDVFNSNFTPAQLAGSFTDPNLPAGFAPFNVANLDGNVYVTYAKQDADKHDDIAGLGNGFIDVFDLNGNFTRRLASQGTLDSPWGMTIAPPSFGTFARALLVGNFGDGHINAFDPDSGTFLGQLSGANNKPIAIDGLWGLTFGPGGFGGNKNALFFTSGPNDEKDGLLGAIRFRVPMLAVGADRGGGPEVKIFNDDKGKPQVSFFPYDKNFTGGVRVAVGDVNGDGIPDLVTAPGPGGGPDIKVFDGDTDVLILEFSAFDPNFSGGTFIAVGDVDGDGTDEIIVAADAGGGPDIAVFSGKDGSRMADFFAFSPNFTGGVRVTVGDVDGDGKADIIAGAGAGGGPNVTVFTITSSGPTVLQSFFAFDSHFSAGVFVAAGDVNGDGKFDIIVGAGAGGGPNVTVFNGVDASLLRSFFAFDPSFAGGVRVVAGDDNGDGNADIIVGPGPGGGPDVRRFRGDDGIEIDRFFAFDAMFTGGVFVAADD